jgi:hypothetical protein
MYWNYYFYKHAHTYTDTHSLLSVIVLDYVIIVRLKVYMQLIIARDRFYSRRTDYLIVIIIILKSVLNVISCNFINVINVINDISCYSTRYIFLLCYVIFMTYLSVSTHKTLKC